MIMAKKRCWFGWCRRFFLSEKKPKTEQRSKRWRWGGFGRIKIKGRPALPAAPQRSIKDATDKQREYALTVALATAAAAEAAVAAAQAAAEVVRLTASNSQSSSYVCKEVQNLAAVKIQSAFRAYLARKALRALKGLVKLQAIVRGRAVRRQSVIKLKSLQLTAKKMQKDPILDGSFKDGENKQVVKSRKELKEKESKLEYSSQRSWDYSTLSREDMEALWLKKQEATIQRERMMKYSFSHRERRNTQILDETLSLQGNDYRKDQWLEQWGLGERRKKKGLEILSSIAIPSFSNSSRVGAAPIKTRYHPNKNDSVEVLSSPMSLARQSFGRTRQILARDDSSVPNSPVFPTYMAATQSAKAKSRSMSTPRQRVGFQDVCIDHGLHNKHGLSFWSSHDGELFGSGKRKTFQHTPYSLNYHQ